MMNFLRKKNFLLCSKSVEFDLSDKQCGYPNFSPYFRALCSIRRPTNSSPPQFAAIHGEFLLKKITSEKKFQRSIHSSPVVLVRYSGNTVVVN